MLVTVLHLFNAFLLGECYIVIQGQYIGINTKMGKLLDMFWHGVY